MEHLTGSTKMIMNRLENTSEKKRPEAKEEK